MSLHAKSRAPRARPPAPDRAAYSAAHHAGAALLAVVVAAAAYLDVLRNGFVWDDTQQILRNPYLRPGAAWRPLFNSDVWSFTHPGLGAVNNYYRPLQMLMYRITARAFGFWAPAFHAVNLAFHLLATLLVYCLVFQLTRRAGLALAASVLFGVHPVHTEAVAWIAGLPELGCAVFYLLASLLFLLSTRGRRWLRWASWASFGVALLWKEMAVTLPLVLGLYLMVLDPDALPARARMRRAARATWPYWAVLAAYLPLRYHALGFLYVSQRRWVLSPLNYVLTVVDFFGKYWWKLVAPWPLNAFYVFDPVRSLAEPRVLAALLFVVVAGAGLVYGIRRLPLAAFATGWVFLTLIPVLNLRGVGRNVFAERYLYLPSVGVCLLAAWLAGEAMKSRRWVGVASVGLAVVLGGVATARRNLVWRDDFTLFSQTAAASPNSADMEDGLAAVLYTDRDDLVGAWQAYQRALVLAAAQQPPERDQIESAEMGLGLIAGDRGNYDQALAWLDRARAADPDAAGLASARGGILLQAGRWQEAQGELQAALAAHPSDANAWNALGFIAWHYQHQDAKALDDFQQALATHPPSASFQAALHNSLGAVLGEMGRFPESIAEFQQAIGLQPDDAEYPTNLAEAYRGLGRLAAARAELEQALALAPDYEPAQAALSKLDEQH